MIEGGGADPDIADFVDPESDAGKALAAMKRVDRDFSVAEFTHGARAAYEMIVMAYENGDLDTLRQFLSPEVYEPFAEAIDARAGQGLHGRGELRRHPRGQAGRRPFRPRHQRGRHHHALRRRAHLGGARPEGRIVEGEPNEIKQQKDVWTFTRDMTSDNPNWLLTGTGG